MKSFFSTLLLVFCVSMNAQLNYFTMGSTQNKVVQIQGEPSSVSKVANYTTFSYGASTVSFKNGLVDGYHNSGNLKVKMMSSNTTSSSSNSKKVAQTTKKENSHAKKKTKKVNNPAKWIYFTYLSSEPTFDLSNNYNGRPELAKDEYSKLYSISGYTYELQSNLEFCLTKNYKEFYGHSATLFPHVFDDRDSALSSWKNEKGRMARSSSCYYLMQYGVMEQ